MTDRGESVAPQVTRESALAWLTLKTWGAAGSLCFGMTENGDVGLFEAGAEAALGVGDTCDEALVEAHRSYHRTLGLERCQCARIEADGDALP